MAKTVEDFEVPEGFILVNVKGFITKLGDCENCKLQAKIEQQQEALEQSSKIFSKKLKDIRRRENNARYSLCFTEGRHWRGIYYQIFELRHEIERMLSNKELNEFCILSVFMTEEKRKEAVAETEEMLKDKQGE